MALPLGRTTPRLFTPPLRELTPDTSYGFAVVAFARDVLLEPLDPWQEWLAVRVGELLPDGRPRFRQVLVIVARQQGKTHLLKVLTLFWQFVQALPLIVGMSTNLDYARESWEKAVETAESVPILTAMLARNGVRKANGEQQMKTVDRARYKIAASNRKGGRSLTIWRLVLDELREHHDWSAWNAAVPATNAVPAAQVFAITNQGDDRSVVLDTLRQGALAFVEAWETADDGTRTAVAAELLESGSSSTAAQWGDPRLGIFEWSAPDGCEIDDPDALAAANPNAGRRTDWDTLLGPARRIKANGNQEEIAGWRTEIMCQRVRQLDAAIDPEAWQRAARPRPFTDLERTRLALCLDVSPDQRHATLVAAAAGGDGKVRLEIVAAWEGLEAPRLAAAALPGWVAKVKPRAFGWFPTGPAAAVAADVKDRGDRRWPPRGVEVAEITGEAPAVCMGFANAVLADEIHQPDDPLLNAHAAGAAKLWAGDRWRFARRGAGHCDALYAAAGAAHLARTLPQGLGKPRVVLPRSVRR